MIKSLFGNLVDQWMHKIVGAITETINDKNAEENLLFTQKLGTEYSPTLTWATTQVQNSIVAADVVSMDSSIPLKSRPSISKASGDIPKLALKYPLKEKTLTDINIMKAQGAQESEIVAKLFDDTNRCIKGIRHRLEIMFLQALSTGSTLVSASETEGTGIRVDFGYKAENKFKAKTAVWSSVATATPITDINQMFDKANDDNSSIAELYISKKYLDYLRNSNEGKRLVASGKGYNVDDANLGTPTRNDMVEALKNEYECDVIVVSSKFSIEGKDGSITKVAPYAEEMVVGVPSSQIGTLYYGTLAEETNPVSGVNYEKSGSYILVSKYAKTDPLQEFTAGQALAIPVLNNTNYIYQLNANSK